MQTENHNKLKVKYVKMKKLQLAIMAAALVIAAQARATLFDISFIDSTAANIAAGIIDVNLVNGLATSGTLTVVNGVAAGSYNLIPTPGLAVGVFTSPSGAFYYDNQIQGIPPGPPSAPFLDIDGLAFTGTGVQSGTEVNLWGTSAGVNGYTFYGHTAAGGYNPTVDGGAAISLAVPEPTTMIAGALLLLPFGASTIRILRKKQ